MKQTFDWTKEKLGTYEIEVSENAIVYIRIDGKQIAILHLIELTDLAEAKTKEHKTAHAKIKNKLEKKK